MPNSEKVNSSEANAHPRSFTDIIRHGAEEAKRLGHDVVVDVGNAGKRTVHPDGRYDSNPPISIPAADIPTLRALVEAVLKYVTADDEVIHCEVDRAQDAVRELLAAPADAQEWNFRQILMDVLQSLEGRKDGWLSEAALKSTLAHANRALNLTLARHAPAVPAVPPQTWISVEDDTPKFSGTYIVAVDGLGDDGERYTSTLPADWSVDGKYWHDLRGWGTNEVTHWSALPSPPVSPAKEPSK